MAVSIRPSLCSSGPICSANNLPCSSAVSTYNVFTLLLFCLFALFRVYAAPTAYVFVSFYIVITMEMVRRHGCRDVVRCSCCAVLLLVSVTTAVAITFTILVVLSACHVIQPPAVPSVSICTDNQRALATQNSVPFLFSIPYSLAVKQLASASSTAGKAAPSRLGGPVRAKRILMRFISNFPHSLFGSRSLSVKYTERLIPNRNSIFWRRQSYWRSHQPEFWGTCPPVHDGNSSLLYTHKAELKHTSIIRH